MILFSMAVFWPSLICYVFFLSNFLVNGVTSCRIMSIMSSYSCSRLFFMGFVVVLLIFF